MKTSFNSFEEAYEYIKTLTTEEKLELCKEIHKRSHGADKRGMKSIINFYEKKLSKS